MSPGLRLRLRPPPLLTARGPRPQAPYDVGAPRSLLPQTAVPPHRRRPEATDAPRPSRDLSPVCLSDHHRKQRSHIRTPLEPSPGVVGRPLRVSKGGGRRRKATSGGHGAQRPPGRAGADQASPPTITPPIPNAGQRKTPQPELRGFG